MLWYFHSHTSGFWRRKSWDMHQIDMYIQSIYILNMDIYVDANMIWNDRASEMTETICNPSWKCTKGRAWCNPQRAACQMSKGCFNVKVCCCLLLSKGWFNVNVCYCLLLSKGWYKVKNCLEMTAGMKIWVNWGNIV